MMIILLIVTLAIASIAPTATIAQNPCANHRCRNGGQCVAYPGSLFQYECSCAPCNYGRFCERRIDQCLNHKCRNGAICQRVQNSCTDYMCVCNGCFEGEFCRYTIPDPCTNRPCVNGGQCSRVQGCCHAYECSCPPGFEGANCEIERISCVGGCQNGGTCASEECCTCNCPRGYVGTRCEQDCLLGQLEDSQVQELQTNLDNLIADMGGQLDVTRLAEEEFYSRTLVAFTEPQEQDILNSCVGAGIFRPISEFDQTSRKRRNSHISRVCPVDEPRPANLVALQGNTDRQIAQVARMGNQVQTNVYNEECMPSRLECGGYGCSCTKVSRTVTALVLVIPMTAEAYNVTLESVEVYSCAALDRD
ncbi:uncharacterized protein [Amphiura filiformis]|uniref:uncharacterized protein n=1 Tax=Amphiura filiformis TaxID=82378 RepID=UPI003B222214